MNILFLSNELKYSCGVTSHLKHLISGLNKSGIHDLFLLCGNGEATEKFSNLSVSIGINPKLKHQNRTIINYHYAKKFVTDFVKKNNIDIIHSHTHYAANIAAGVSKNTGVKTIQTNHGLLSHTGRLTHFNAQHYIVINEHVLEYFRNFSIAPEDKINFIRCGIEIPSFISKNSEAKIKIITACRLVKEKGAGIFIRAVSKLKPEIKSIAEFFIAGDGEEKENLLRLNKELNAGINLTGSIKDMKSLLEQTHIFCYCSKSENEGFPAIITEAGAYGCLVLTSEFRGLTPVFEPGNDGLTFNIENENSLVSTLEDAIINFSKYRDNVSCFYKKIKFLFSIEEMTAKHLKLYNKCLAG